MTKFKVGDKVRILTVEFTGNGPIQDHFNVGALHKIIDTRTDDLLYCLETPCYYSWFPEGALELVEEGSFEISETDVNELFDIIKGSCIIHLPPTEMEIMNRRLSKIEEMLGQVLGLLDGKQVGADLDLSPVLPTSPFLPPVRVVEDDLSGLPPGKIIGICDSGYLVEDVESPPAQPIPRNSGISAGDQVVNKDARRSNDLILVSAVVDGEATLTYDDGRSRKVSLDVLNRRYRKLT